MRHLALLAAGVQMSLVAFFVAAMFHPIAYQFYFFSIGGLAVALSNIWHARECGVARRRERFVKHGGMHGVTNARILKVVPTLMCGGTENQFMTLSRRLDPARFDLEFACLRRWGPFVEELADRRIPLSEYQVATFRSVQALAQQARLARHIARRGIEIVHAYNFYGNVFAVPPARLAAPVVIASIRDCAPYLTAMQKRVQRYACQFADCVLVNADAVKDWLIGRRLRPLEDRRHSQRRRPVAIRRTGGPAARIRRELGLAPTHPARRGGLAADPAEGTRALARSRGDAEAAISRRPLSRSSAKRVRRTCRTSAS